MQAVLYFIAFYHQRRTEHLPNLSHLSCFLSFFVSPKYCLLMIDACLNLYWSSPYPSELLSLATCRAALSAFEGYSEEFWVSLVLPEAGGLMWMFDDVWIVEQVPNVLNWVGSVDLERLYSVSTTWATRTLRSTSFMLKGRKQQTTNCTCCTTTQRDTTGLIAKASPDLLDNEWMLILKN